MEDVPEEQEVIEEEEEVKKSLLPAWAKYVIAAVVVGLVAFYLYATGWGGYAVAYVKCGVRQPIIGRTIDNAKLYYTPEHRRYSVPGEGAAFMNYYCDEPQAKAAGFLRAGP